MYTMNVHKLNYNLAINSRTILLLKKVINYLSKISKSYSTNWYYTWLDVYRIFKIVIYKICLLIS